MSLAESKPIWFVSTALGAAAPFLLLAALTAVLVALHDALAWFVKRGLTRRRQRLEGGRR